MKSKKIGFLIMFIMGILMVFCLVIPLLHDFLFNSFSLSNYEEKEGIVSDVILKNGNESSTCESIVVDDYNIFVQCGSNYKQQFSIGDKTKYYVYKDKAYHTEAQMKSASFIGKLLDYGMLGTYVVILLLLTFNQKRIITYVNGISNN